eukprot:350255-Chlamydomonas_euryale.AAC.24
MDAVPIAASRGIKRPVSRVISIMRASAVSGARHAAPNTAAAPTTTNVVVSTTSAAWKCPAMSPTSAPRNSDGAKRPPTRPPPTQMLVAAILAASRPMRLDTDKLVESRKISSRLT